MKFYLAFATVLLLAAQVNAAELNVTATTTAIDPGTFVPLPVQPDLNQSQPGPVTLQIDFAFEVSNFAANERNFANLAFDIELGPGITDLFNWGANADTFPAGPPGPTGDLAAWATNLDAGASATDLNGILASIAGGLGESDPRSSLGESAPQGIGQLFVEWDGSTESSVSLTNLVFSMVDNGGQIAPSSQASGPSFTLGGVPEPTSLALASLGMIGLLSTRRRRS